MSNMLAKVITNIDPRSDRVYYELKVGEEYNVEEVVIHSYSTDVYLENGNYYNSVMFDDEFQDKLDEAIDMFNSDEDSQVGDRFGVFVRDYY